MQVWVCFLSFMVFFWQHLHNSTQAMVGRVTLSQPARGKDPSKKDPATIKLQLYPENQIKAIKGIQRASSSGDQGD